MPCRCDCLPNAAGLCRDSELGLPAVRAARCAEGLMRSIAAIASAPTAAPAPSQASTGPSPEKNTSKGSSPKDKYKEKDTESMEVMGVDSAMPLLPRRRRRRQRTPPPANGGAPGWRSRLRACRVPPRRVGGHGLRPRCSRRRSWCPASWVLPLGCCRRQSSPTRGAARGLPVSETLFVPRSVGGHCRCCCWCCCSAWLPVGRARSDALRHRRAARAQPDRRAHRRVCGGEGPLGLPPEVRRDCVDQAGEARGLSRGVPALQEALLRGRARFCWNWIRACMIRSSSCQLVLPYITL